MLTEVVHGNEQNGFRKGGHNSIYVQIINLMKWVFLWNRKAAYFSHKLMALTSVRLRK